MSFSIYKKRAASWLMVLTFAALVQTGHPAPAMQTLHKFSPTNSAPQFPLGRLVEGKDGCFYGTTILGGSQSNGVVFKMTAIGELTVLCAMSATNGWGCLNGLTFGSDGDLYGAASAGGLDDQGTIFKITTNGVLTRLFSFTGTNAISATNGGRPDGPLVVMAGEFYGVTEYGGSYGRGTVFRVTTNGALTTLFSFASTNGIAPCGGLVVGGNNNLYGMTSFGGTNGGTEGYGTVFRITTNGSLTTLVNFDGTNGLAPDGRLTLGSDGNFYGITRLGSPYGLVDYGGSSNRGSIFRMTPDGAVTNLVFFSDTNGNGNTPYSLTQGRDGKLYGATRFIGEGRYNTPTNYGTIFCVTTNGELTTLVHFNGANGKNPWIDFTLGSDGNLYAAVGEDAFAVSTDGSAGSIIRLVEPPVLTTISHTNGGTAVTWSSFTNGMYQVEYKSSLAATNWLVLTNSVTATGDTTFLMDAASGAAERYYRVRLLP